MQRSRIPDAMSMDHTSVAYLDDSSESQDAAARARARLMELEERMQFLNGLESSIKELIRDPDERMLDYMNSPLRAASSASGKGDGTREEGNPRSPAESRAKEMMLPNEVNADSDLEDAQSPTGGRQHEEPLEGKEIFDRMSSLIEKVEDSKNVEEMSVLQLRSIIREEVAEKVRDSSLMTLKQAANGNMVGSNVEDLATEQSDPHKSAPRDRLPRNLSEAVPVSLPLFFGGFSRQSPIRFKCIQICKDETWNVVFLLTLMANCAYIAAVPDDKNLESPGWLAFDTVCNIIYSIEIVCNIVAYGFVGHNGWASVSMFHQIEFAVFVAMVSEQILNSMQIELGITAKPFRLLRIIKQLVTMKTFASVRIILDTLAVGSGQLSVVFLMFIFFLCTFGIFFLQILKYSFRRNCILDTRVVSYSACASDFSTGWNNTCNLKAPAAAASVEGGAVAFRGFGYPGVQYEGTFCKVYCYPKEECKQLKAYGQIGPYCDEACPQNYPADAVNDFGVPMYPRDRWGRIHSCTMPNAYCSPSSGNPVYGLQHFDNIGGFIPAMLQIAVPDSAYTVLHQALQSEPSTAPLIWGFVILCTVVCTWLMLGLFVAVVTGTFERVRARYGQRAEAKGSVERAAGATEDDEEDEEYHLDEVAKFQRTARLILYESDFPLVMSVIIVIHFSAMIIELQIPDLLEAALVFQYISYAMFVVEACLSAIAYGGISSYFRESQHKLELLLILFSVLSFVPGCKFLGYMCSVRLFRLMKYFETLQGLLLCAASSGQAILNLVLFLAMLCICFAITGRYIFKDLLNDNTRSHFGSNPVAILTIFQLLIGDSWSGVVYEGMRVQEEALSRMFAAAFIILWFCFSKLVVSNIFVAVIIENFRVMDTINAAKMPGPFSKFSKMLYSSYASMNAIPQRSGDVHDEFTEDGHLHVDVKEAGKLVYSFDADCGDEGESEVQFRAVRTNPILRSLMAESMSRPDNTMHSIDAKSKRAEMARILGCIGHDNLFKQLFQLLVRHPLFDFTIYAVIIAGCVILMTTPPYEDITDNQPMLSLELRNQLEFAFTGIFTFEFFARVMCQGFLFTPNAYLKDNWNRVDVTVLFFAWIDLMGVFEGTSFAKVLRVTRGLKPLRMMKRLKGLRTLIDALIMTLQPVAYVFVVFLTIMLCFSTVGMGMFGHKMYRCTDQVFAAFPGGKSECMGSFVSDSGIIYPRAWIRPPHNFDTLAGAMDTLFRVAMVKYVAVLSDIQDITDVDQSPKKEFSVGYSFFIIFFLIVGTFFIFNLLVAFIVDGFNVNRDSSAEEIQYRRLLRHVKQFMPKPIIARPPRNEVSTYMRSVATGTIFTRVSTACVMTNVLLLLADHTEPDPTWLNVQYAFDLFFFAELCGEVFVNLVAFGVGGFFSDSWKIFDLLVALISGIGYAAPDAGNVAVMVRASRAFRIVRLMRMINALRVILETIVSAIPQLMNILMLVSLFLVMFSAVFMQNYATVKSGLRLEGGKRRSDSLRRTASFETFPNSLSTLYQILIGDEWHQLMDDASVQYPECTRVFAKSSDPSDSMFTYSGPDYAWGDCGSTSSLPSARILFPLFIIFGQAVLLNLVIGMILDNFSFITDQVDEVEDPDWSGGATAEQIHHLATIFSLHCLQSGGGHAQFLPLWGVTALLRDMPEPIGYRPVKNPQVVLWGAWERTTEKLIRAQLNINARNRRQAWELAHKSENTEEESFFPQAWVRKIFHRSVSSREHQHLEYTDFHEFLLTAICWRKPAMLPVYIRTARFRMFKDIVVTLSSLIIKDALARNTAMIHKKETNRALAAKAEFDRWAANDVHYAKRATFRLQRKLARQRRAEASAVYRHIEEVPPVSLTEIMLQTLDELPPKMIPHHDTVRWEGHHKFPRPMHGIEWFIKQAAKNKVVLKFLDVRNSSIGLVLADFTKCSFEGWIREGEPDDTVHLFLPAIAKARADLQDIDWVDVRLSMHASAKAGGGRRRKKNNGAAQQQDRIVKLGSLLDVQGCSVFTEVNSAGKPKDPINVVRLNLGSPLFGDELRTKTAAGGYFARGASTVMSLKERSRKKEIEKEKIVKAHRTTKVEVYDSILEVVGYMGSVDGAEEQNSPTVKVPVEDHNVDNPLAL